MKISITEKRCYKCKIVKSVSEFGKNRSKHDGMATECKRCHVEQVEKYRQNNAEKVVKQRREHYYKNLEESREKSRRWGRNHKEERRRKSVEWYKNNKEKAKEISKKYYEKNKNTYILNAKKWASENKERRKEIVKVSTNNRRAAIGKNKVSKKEWLELCESFGNKCLRCGKTGVTLSMDHVIPLSKGGLNIIGNIQPLCVSCNSRKHTKTIDYRKVHEV